MRLDLKKKTIRLDLKKRKLMTLCLNKIGYLHDDASPKKRLLLIFDCGDPKTIYCSI